MNWPAAVEEIVEVFRREQQCYHDLPLRGPQALEAAIAFIDAHYATDVVVIHAHHSSNLFQGLRRSLGSGHPHELVDLKAYIRSNVPREIEAFHELHHTMQWLSVRCRNDRGLAVVGMVMEGVERLRRGASLPARDPQYSPYYCHAGVWVMRQETLPGAVWKTHFVVSGLPVDQCAPGYTSKIAHEELDAYEENWRDPSWWERRQPKPLSFDRAPVDAQMALVNDTTGLLGWEGIIDSLE